MMRCDPASDEAIPWVPADPDVPDGDFVCTDRLDRAELAEHVAIVIGQLPSPFTVAVYGGWGEGKTFLLRDVQHRVAGSQDVNGLWCHTVWFDLVGAPARRQPGDRHAGDGP